MQSSDLQQMLTERDALLVREYNAALDLADLAAHDTVLDVATGSGRMLLELLRRGHTVVSGDLDPEALNRARERVGDLADKMTLMTLDAHRLQFEDDSFRAATLANAVHEIDNPRAALDEITRVLAPDGKLLVVEFNTQGYDLIELHHKVEGRGEHPRGEMRTNEIDRYLRSLFQRVETKESTITHAWLASNKQQRVK